MFKNRKHPEIKERQVATCRCGGALIESVLSFFSHFQERQIVIVDYRCYRCGYVYSFPPPLEKREPRIFFRYRGSRQIARFFLRNYRATEYVFHRHRRCISRSL